MSYRKPTREQVVRQAMMPQPSQAVMKPMDKSVIADDRYLAHLTYRIRRLPVQLEAARRKVALLEAEARKLGMTDLLEVGNDR